MQLSWRYLVLLLLSVSATLFGKGSSAFAKGVEDAALYKVNAAVVQGLNRGPLGTACCSDLLGMPTTTLGHFQRLQHPQSAASPTSSRTSGPTPTPTPLIDDDDEHLDLARPLCILPTWDETPGSRAPAPAWLSRMALPTPSLHQHRHAHSAAVTDRTRRRRRREQRAAALDAQRNDDHGPRVFLRVRLRRGGLRAQGVFFI
ncbi:hypothetical protein DL768_000220 [Monosporascus sp. mg162]|nr:hypothetical protein DL768_000220 [Monosporascus sp. mg162]